MATEIGIAVKGDVYFMALQPVIGEDPSPYVEFGVHQGGTGKQTGTPRLVLETMTVEAFRDFVDQCLGLLGALDGKAMEEGRL